MSDRDDMSLVELIVKRGQGAVDVLPKGIRESRKAVAETIENNVRRVIAEQKPVNPKYYEKMSELLDLLIKQRREEALEYQRYLQEIVELTKQVQDPTAGGAYPPKINTRAKQALYDNLGKDEELALAIDYVVLMKRKDDWRGHMVKEREIKYAIREVLKDDAKAEE